MFETIASITKMEYIPHPADPAVRLRLLVVDDDTAFRIACGQIVESLGYAVDSTDDLDRARALLKARGADILLVNLIPESNQGREFIYEVKLLYPGTSVIAMTTSRSVNPAVEAMRCGASDYLTKPFGMDELSSVLDRAASYHASDAEARQLHLGLLPPAPPEKDPIHEHHVRGLELKLLYAGPRALTTSEKRELLLSGDSIRRLRPETAEKENPAAGVTQAAVSV